MEEAEVMELARKARNQYQRAWRAKNREKVKEINQRYWTKKVLGELNGREDGTQQPCR